MSTGPKRTWKQALADAEALRDLFPRYCWERWEFAGSIRRRCSEVSDVDHVIKPAFGEIANGDGLFVVRDRGNLFWHALDKIVKDGTLSKHIYGTTGFRWGDIYRGVDCRGMKHELWTADKDNWGAILCIRTGSGDYSQRAVETIRKAGVLRQYKGYLRRVPDGCGPESEPSATWPIVSAPDEEAYFRLNGLPFVPPEKRF